MAEDNGQLRTEEPTPRRREEAKKRGQVAFSPELTGAVIVMSGVAFLAVMGPETGRRLLDAFRADFDRLPTELDSDEARALFGRVFGRFAAILGGLFGLVAIAGVGACLAQVGFFLRFDRLAPDFGRISPETGLGRLFSTESIKRVGMAMLKATALVTVALLVLRGRAGVIEDLGGGSAAQSVISMWQIAIRVLLYLAGTLLALGVIDYFFQWQRIESALRMTKQEVKDEAKREEGDPLIKARIRIIQRQRAQMKMRVNVPKATVVITNPTHYAVALRYERGASGAPKVIARGAGAIARQIGELARRYAIPVLERPPLARALYAAVKEGQEVPPELFRAVAEVIAFVFRLRGAA